MLLSAKQRPAGAFLPFIRDQPGASSFLSRPTPRTVASAADLSLSLGERTTTPSSRNLRPSDSEVGSIDAGLQTPEVQIPKDIGVMSNGTSGAGSSSGGGNPTRKSRRCWSPELHRRFVSALHQLGGSQSRTSPPSSLNDDSNPNHLYSYDTNEQHPLLNLYRCTDGCLEIRSRLVFLQFLCVGILLAFCSGVYVGFELHKFNFTDTGCGCAVATPKQIRELMKVDGLTNDEVKSHLQVYTLLPYCTICERL